MTGPTNAENAYTESSQEAEIMDPTCPRKIDAYSMLGSGHVRCTRPEGHDGSCRWGRLRVRVCFEAEMVGPNDDYLGTVAVFPISDGRVLNDESGTPLPLNVPSDAVQ